ncbi:aspartate aminotransferase family protein [Galbitalea soli]|uniref:Aminotransferase class III-fold pyridoxal phosphate-dependent enzyme n=1 Tax=Galbitalea soli TaxID=1268042 RepID=A0A7C9PP09_9MICO|nr:aminotransferase class III-fold pyridoxal phosphate-dependent enzyme [Galbitalea soli]NEM92005.1 aminotransferase class III-fold pyridoxal phosphate-dependent enzyme [Galbitalea soli]NYJ32043.1 4-aminobutyrate aminotransferase-like enzyme [Galbitalea soli]
MPGPTTYFDPATTSHLDPRTRDLVERRARSLGSAYRLFYRTPLEFVRGEGAHLFTADGTDYLDAYNNVPSVGHAHPRVAAAIAEQAARLSTHTRYLSRATVDYAEDLLGTFPAHLGNVMFTCTGSEANDLALRIVRAATGRRGVIVTENAYHGVTTEVAALSPSLVGADAVADWVRVVPAPTPGTDFAAAVAAAIDSLDAAGIGLGCLIVDTIFASDGVLPDAPGLAAAARAAQAAGGLLVADEVQPGFGRLGDGLWGFDRHGLVPDLVTLGKPMGNGYPVAAVVARPELVDAFAARGRYFNTFGGNTVAIAAAQATLDVVREEGLVARAARLGAVLAEGLRAIGGSVVEVRGCGLFLGVQLGDEGTAREAVNALEERRILIGASGLRNDTLKVRPPLALSDADAERLLDGLAAVLG